MIRVTAVLAALALAAVFCVGLVLIAGCELVEREELQRLDDPSGKVQALLVRTAIASSGSSDYDVILVERGRRSWLGEEVVFLGGARRPPTLEWAGTGELRVLHGSASRKELERPQLEMLGRTIHVTLEHAWVYPTGKEAVLPAMHDR